MAFEWEISKETFNLPLGCLQGGRVGSYRLFQLPDFLPQVAGFRREPMQIKGLIKAIRSHSDGWWDTEVGLEAKKEEFVKRPVENLD